MNKLLKPLIALAGLALMPVTASALPGDCDDVCDCNTPCSNRCTTPGGRTILTCGTWELNGCIDLCRVKASETIATAEDARDAEDAELTCREPRKDAEG